MKKPSPRSSSELRTEYKPSDFPGGLVRGKYASRSVWDAIEDTAAGAESMKLRSAMMIALREHIEREGLGPARAATLLGVTQPRVSDLLRGKINLFSIDALVNMLATAGLQVELRVNKAT